MNRNDYETLKDCMKQSAKTSTPLKMWCASFDNVLMVARILKGEYTFTGHTNDDTAENIIDYFEKPWHWETDMRDLIVEYELDKVSKDLEYLTLDQADEAILWLDEFCHFDYKTIQALLETLEERYVLCGYAPCGVK